jgi:hypothetical protein
MTASAASEGPCVRIAVPTEPVGQVLHRALDEERRRPQRCRPRAPGAQEIAIEDDGGHRPSYHDRNVEVRGSPQ